MKLVTLSVGLLFGLLAQTASANYCEAFLKSRNGRILEQFYGNGPNRQRACNRAMRQCREELQFRQSYGQNRQAYCDTRFGGGGGGGQYVTRTCRSRLVGRYGRQITSFRGTATGYQGTGLRRQACNDARRRCNRYRNRQGYYQANCITDGQTGPGGPWGPGPNRPPGGGPF